MQLEVSGAILLWGPQWLERPQRLNVRMGSCAELKTAQHSFKDAVSAQLRGGVTVFQKVGQ